MLSDNKWVLVYIYLFLWENNLRYRNSRLIIIREIFIFLVNEEGNFDLNLLFSLNLFLKRKKYVIICYCVNIIDV